MMTILIADDHAIVRDGLKQILARTGDLPRHDVAHVEGIEDVDEADAIGPNLHPAPVSPGARP